MSATGGEQPLRVDRDGPLAIVTIDSPPLNLFDEPLGRALDEALSSLEGDPARAVLFRAEGRVFSGGVDVSLFASLRGSADAAALFDRLVATARRVDRLPALPDRFLRTRTVPDLGIRAGAGV